ncbi:hypothetical protein AGABI2DRAFT_69866, partial [Agaricus bisporus var. bisporus H97]|uniref:hypothetical protein n=1 Tax=Agaricus bisporus var. bisporus (strain H97 / ATCC MYA-4626 / FGSC 10389) TaxID=936046 RepID=UPI00029F573B
MRPLARLCNKWTASMYAFFHPEPKIEWRGVKGTNERKKYLKFKCIAPHCRSAGRHGPFVFRALEGSDSTSTKNLRHHTEGCYGKEVLAAADRVGSIEKRREIIAGRNNDLRDSSLVLAFEKQGPGRPTYSTRPPTKAESKAYHEGRPGHYIPSPSTLRRDLKKVFVSARHQVSQLLRAHPGRLHFGTDCWTSPNHCPFIAVTVHYEKDGSGMTWLLDIVEMARSHSGINLAETF